MADRDLDQSPQAFVIPGFSVLDVLHAGRTATVYLARQDDLARLVALKVIHRRMDDPSWRAVEREVKAVAGLSGHPHVVAIYTTGRTPSGEPFLVTEYADRGSLADVIAAQGALPVADAVNVGVGMVDGLAAAHAVGIVHGDVKPGNVLLTSTGGVKLADFGIARLLAGASSTRDRAGFTPAHVAPEVLMGEAAREPADCYGVASTIVEALTGRPPFGTIGSNESATAILRRKLGTDPAPLPGEVPPRLQAALRTALTTDAQRRPRLGPLRLALTEAARQSADDPAPTVPAPVTAPPPPIVVTDRRVRRRRRWLAPVVALALLALLIGVGLALVRRHGPSTTTVGTTVPSGAAPTSAAPTPTSGVAPPTAPASTPTTTAAARTPVATTAAPVTAAPATTAAPVTAAPATAAPSTAASTAPAASTVPRPAPPATVAPGAPVDRARLAEDFLRKYYATVAARQYQQAWSMLTPEFQRSTGGYQSYVSFWNTVDGIEVRRAQVQPGPDGATWPIVTTLGMRYTLGGRVADENDELTLTPDSAGAPRIAAYRVTGSG